MALMMERVGLIADGVIRARDWNPATFTLTGSTRELFTQAAQDALAEAWSRKWPQLKRVEPRRFRPAWDTDQAYAVGHEVWHAATEAYWKCLVAHSGQVPAVGSAYWEQPEEFVPFVQLDQPWEAYRMDDAGVDLNDFAYEEDPRLNPNAAPLHGCAWWMDSVVLPQEAPDQVWVKFWPACPRITFAEWAAGTAYAAGETAYRTLNGRCYVALKATTGEVPEETTGSWSEVQIPEFLGTYVRQFVLSQWLSVSEGRYEMEAKAERTLAKLECRMFERAGGDGEGARVSVGMRRV